MSDISRHMLRSGILLTLFAVVGTGLLSFTNEMTRDQIIQNERDALLKNLHAIIDPGTHDNDLYADTMQVTNTLLGSKEPVEIYRARKQGKPVAAVFSSVAPNGYSGKIKLLIGVDMAGSIMGVRIISHRETPGLGDAIELEKSNWILSFNKKSLDSPALQQWKVKKDGGVFDQFTGATITPRAVVATVRNTLIYFKQYKDSIFSQAAPAGVENE